MISRYLSEVLNGRSNSGKLKQAVQAKRAETSLSAFVRMMWHVVEPDRPLIWGPAMDAICDSLEAVTDGRITRLLINVPPGFSKSLLTDVFWPAWEWGPKGRPSTRYVAFSYASFLTERDNGRFAALISSPLYQEFWGKRFKLPPMWGNTKVSNDRTGWKFATSVAGVGTGERGDRVIIDDPHNVKEGESQAKRTEAVRWFSESITTRLNDPETSAIVVIMQRVHEDDISGHIISQDLGYVHLCLPMVYDGRHCEIWLGDELFFTDWRSQEGELLFPERFPDWVVERDQKAMGPYAFAGQMQQAPTPRGGGILKRDWWQSWPPESWPASKRNNFPPFEFVVASLDTALSEHETNDYTALTVWGIFRDTGYLMANQSRLGEPGDTIVVPAEEQPKIMLIYGWQKRLDLNGAPEERPDGLTDAEWMSPDWRALRTKNWGVVEWVVDTCRLYGVDILLIENKTRGHDVAKEIVRLHANQSWNIVKYNPVGDKVARAYSVQPMLSNGQVWAPLAKAWAQAVVDQCASFPKSAHDDLVDTVTAALRWLRDNGMALLKHEVEDQYADSLRPRPAAKPLYDT